MGRKVVHWGDHASIVTMGAYEVRRVRPHDRDADVVIHASYSGVLLARFVGRHLSHEATGVDGAIGKDGAGIAGLGISRRSSSAPRPWTWTWPPSNSLTASTSTRRIIVNRANAIATAMGVAIAMPVQEATPVLLVRQLA